MSTTCFIGIAGPAIGFVDAYAKFLVNILIDRGATKIIHGFDRKQRGFEVETDIDLTDAEWGTVAAEADAALRRAMGQSVQDDRSEEGPAVRQPSEDGLCDGCGTAYSADCELCTAVDPDAIVDAAAEIIERIDADASDDLIREHFSVGFGIDGVDIATLRGALEEARRAPHVIEAHGLDLDEDDPNHAYMDASEVGIEPGRWPESIDLLVDDIAIDLLRREGPLSGGAGYRYRGTDDTGFILDILND